MPKSADAFRTISEVADWLGVQPHVLRFWESKFSQVKPVKRAGGRRYYRPNDMLLLGGLRKLLHEDGLTIKGAQKVLREQGMAYVAGMSAPLDEETAAQLGDDAGLSTSTDAVEVADAPMEVAEAPPEERVVSFEPRSEPTAEPTSEPPAPAPEPAPAAEPAMDLQPLDQAPADPEAADAEPVQSDIVPETAEAMPAFITGASADPEPATEAPEDLTLSTEPEHTDTPTAEAEDVTASAPGELEDIQPQDAQADETVEAAPLDAAPRPNIIDAPDPDETSLDANPGVLSAAFRARNLSPSQKDALGPLVAQLAALRDRQASARSGGPK